eukprot:3854062-Rhodomonas_salina.1
MELSGRLSGRLGGSPAASADSADCNSVCALGLARAVALTRLALTAGASGDSELRTRAAWNSSTA